MRKWNFFKWTRDNQKRFADEVAEELDNRMPLNGGTITGVLDIKIPPQQNSNEYPIQFSTQYNETASLLTWRIGASALTPIFYIRYGNTNLLGLGTGLGLFSENKSLTLGYKDRPWAKTFTKIISNGDEEIIVPSKAGTFALVSDIEDILRKHGLIPPETTDQEEQA